jgi:hypothetical protein
VFCVTATAANLIELHVLSHIRCEALWVSAMPCGSDGLCVIRPCLTQRCAAECKRLLFTSCWTLVSHSL